MERHGKIKVVFLNVSTLYICALGNKIYKPQFPIIYICSCRRIQQAFQALSASVRPRSQTTTNASVYFKSFFFFCSSQFTSSFFTLLCSSFHFLLTAFLSCLPHRLLWFKRMNQLLISLSVLLSSAPLEFQQEHWLPFEGPSASGYYFIVKGTFPGNFLLSGPQQRRIALSSSTKSGSYAYMAAILVTSENREYLVRSRDEALGRKGANIECHRLKKAQKTSFMLCTGTLQPDSEKQSAIVHGKPHELFISFNKISSPISIPDPRIDPDCK